MEDIRWVQRFSNYRKALARLRSAMVKDQKQGLSELEEQGLIKAFEFTFELAWLTLKDFFEYQGESNLNGSRDVFRLAFERDVVQDGEKWMQMIESRKKSVHTYNDAMAAEVLQEIRNSYFSLFEGLEAKLAKGQGGQSNLFR